MNTIKIIILPIGVIYARYLASLFFFAIYKLCLVAPYSPIEDLPDHPNALGKNFDVHSKGIFYA